MNEACQAVKKGNSTALTERDAVAFVTHSFFKLHLCSYIIVMNVLFTLPVQ